MRSAVLGFTLASVFTTGALSANPAEASAFVRLGDIRTETPTLLDDIDKSSPKMVEEGNAVGLDDIDKSSPKMTEDFEMTEDTGASRVTLTSTTYECVIPKLEIAETTTPVDEIDKSSPKICESADAVILSDFEAFEEEIKVTVRGELNGSDTVDPVFAKVEVMKPGEGATNVVLDEVHADTLKSVR
jgi:hypothetical protein